jgi:arabinose-5-phosphate isomerase
MYLEELYKTSIERSVRRNLTIVSPTDSVYDLVAKMIKDDIGAAVVVDVKKVIGIITEKDVLMRVLLPDKDLHNTAVKDIMTDSPITVESSCSVKEALDMMRKHKVRRLIVTDNGTLFGLVTARRILEQVNFYIADLFEYYLSQKPI